MEKLHLNFGLSFQDLYKDLNKIDDYFLEFLKNTNLKLHNKLLDARANHNTIFDLDESELIISLAGHLENFIIILFKIEIEQEDLSIIYQCNKKFIQRYILKLESQSYDEIYDVISWLKSQEIEILDEKILTKNEVKNLEKQLAEKFLFWYENNNIENLKLAENYSLWAINSIEGRNFHHYGTLFKYPHKTDYDNLIPNLIKIDEKIEIDSQYRRERNGFNLNDDSLSLQKAMHEANYCLYCHNRGKDSCSKGMINLDRGSTPADNVVLHNDASSTGNHSENMALQDVSSTAEFYNIDGNQTINHNGNWSPTADNMAQHNSASNSENFTKKFRDNSLKNELHGCPLSEKISEMNYLKAHDITIGALATIMIDNPMAAATGHRICNDCMKACIFQKQEPVDIPLVETQVVKDVLELPWGFEIYSLLSRWNPLNFKTPIAKEITNHKVLVVGLGPAGFTLSHYLLNEGVTVVAVDGLKIEPLPANISGIDVNGERCEFEAIYNINSIFENLSQRTPYGFGGVMEYGITVRWDKNMLQVIRLLLERRENFRMYGGVRFGSNITYDFANSVGFDHIALSVGAGRPNIPKMENMLVKGVRMASDFLMSLQLSSAFRENNFTPLQLSAPIVVIGSGLTAVDSATEAIQYYKIQVKKFKKQYEILGEKFINSLSDEDKKFAAEFLSEKTPEVTILYRKKLIDSPAYRINHEEFAKAFEEGISFIENATPHKITKDEYGHCTGIIYTDENGKEKFIEARSIIIAIGTHPNDILSREDIKLSSATNISYFGDANPKYNGSVVKAMASAKNEYNKVIENFQKSPKNELPAAEFFRNLDELLLCTVQEVHHLTPDAIEVIVKSPLAAKNFQPGQFFRLQQYEKFKKSEFIMEGIALTGAIVDVAAGLISLIILKVGVSSKMCEYLTPGEFIVLMGPTGKGTVIPHNENVLLIGGGLGNAVLLSIGKKMREQGCKVLYFAGYKRAQDRFKIKEIEKAADIVVWCCDEELLTKTREQDISFQGNILDAIDSIPINMNDIHRIIVIGSDGLMAAVAKARKIKKFGTGIASINSPMQCMMKEICAQCLQKHVINGQEIFVYSCCEQDQNIDVVDFENLRMRLEQNSLLEKTANML